MISIVIPLYNEQETIPELHRRLTDAMKNVNDSYEIIWINDNSKDDSLRVMKSFAEKDTHVKVIDFARNFGHQIAITAGIDSANGEAVILMDGDLQDPPELLPDMIAKWKTGFEVVYTMKKSRKENIVKRFAFHSFYTVMKRFSSIAIPMEAGNFSLLDRKVIFVLKAMPERNRYIAGMRAWAGFRQTGISFDREARFAGKPQMTIMRLINFALDGIFSFSNAPLRFATYIGFFIALFSFAGALYVLYEKLFTDKAILGWSSTIISILFTGGMILFTLGIIGEYIGRIYDEVKQRPLYIVREKIGFEETKNK
mgnify:FL=1